VPTVDLAIPPRSAYVGVVRLVVSSLARTAGIEETAVDDLKIAVSEACANAVLSNEEAGSVAPVSIEWHEDDEGVEVRVGDRGQVYQGGGPEEPFADRLSMSVALLGSLVDDFSFEPRPDGGMLTRLIVRR
jgi:anti-sigma regulatory factor (Ser/Thr protein kinase)